MKPQRHRPKRYATANNEAVDKQILALHQAIALKLFAEPALKQQVLNTLEQRYQAGQLRHSAYIHWFSLLDQLNQPEVFLSELLSDSERMRKLRRRTILVGILTEAERQAVLQTLQ
ncbi:MAG TPA: hypothetical protein VLA40_15500 [Rheinheimera sp.]|nr:hypothetical protein [Rheinheimera sp.]